MHQIYSGSLLIISLRRNLISLFLSNFLTEAPGQYTGPSMGGLVTRGGGGVMMPGMGPMGGQMQPGAVRTSEYSLISD